MIWLKRFLFNVDLTQTGNLIILGIILAVLPVTVFFVQTRQDIRQHAQVKTDMQRQISPFVPPYSTSPTVITPTKIITPKPTISLSSTQTRNIYASPTAVINSSPSSGLR